MLDWIIEPRLGLAMEFAVGLMLILLGIGSVRAGGGSRPIVRPVTIGIVHGLAGSGAVALLVMTTIRDPGWAVVYLLVFGVGTIAGIVLITMAIAHTLGFIRWTVREKPRVPSLGHRPGKRGARAVSGLPDHGHRRPLCRSSEVDAEMSAGTWDG